MKTRKLFQIQGLLLAATLHAMLPGCLWTGPAQLPPDVFVNTGRAPGFSVSDQKGPFVALTPKDATVSQKKLAAALSQGLRKRKMLADASADGPMSMLADVSSREVEYTDIASLPGMSSSLTVSDGRLIRTTTKTLQAFPVKEKVPVHRLYVVAERADGEDIWDGSARTFDETLVTKEVSFSLGILLDSYGKDDERSFYSPRRLSENKARAAESRRVAKENSVLGIIGGLLVLGLLVGAVLQASEDSGR